MNRQEVLDAYEVNKYGLIESPGKFEGEPIYTPAMWNDLLDGGSDEDLPWPDGTNTALCIINDKDRTEWPELPQNTYAIALDENDSGFVSSEALTKTEYDKLIKKNEKLWEGYYPDEEG